MLVLIGWIQGRAVLWVSQVVFVASGSQKREGSRMVAVWVARCQSVFALLGMSRGSGSQDLWDPAWPRELSHCFWDPQQTPCPLASLHFHCTALPARTMSFLFAVTLYLLEVMV